ncbi:ABC transporter permease [Butyrivibrio sp.]|uniref:ABC transporter permease n=1 Tax=Butyrivibrio sp. TaxID=28121 RepID=UPI0025C18C56|nr:FtsX-like permease family protein [Butyrivibrio sp.]MBQ9305133.1 FtsX-like permease family protein [Butyrivibrio sp.]
MILLKKVLRDLRRNAAQFFSIYIMTLLSLFVQAGFEAGNVGSAYSAAEYFALTNYKDLDIQGAYFSYKDIDMLESIPGVNAVDGIARATGKTTLDKERLLVMSFIDGNDVSKMYLTEGTAYEPGATGCWVEARFADPMGLRPGDMLTMTCGNITIKEEIRGVVYCPEYLYYLPNDTYTEPEYGTHGFVIMDISEAPAGFKLDKLIVDLEDVRNNGPLLTDEEKKTMSAMREVVSQRLDNPNVLIKLKTEDEDYNDYAGSMESNDAISTVFPVVFLAVALLGILTTMTRLTESQRVQIGTLKALGFSDRKITLHYMSYSVIITMLGCISGAIIGPIVLGGYLNDINDYYYQNPLQRLQLTGRTFGMCVLTVALCVTVSYRSTRKILIENPARILLPEAPKFESDSFMEKIGIWKRLRFASRWNIRDVRRNKLRTVVSIAGILVCSMLIFLSLGFYECLDNQSYWMYGDIFRGNYQIVFGDDVPYGTVYEYSNEYQGQMAQVSTATIFSDKSESVREMTVLDEGTLFLPEDEELEHIEIPKSGVMLTSRLVDYFGIREGEKISFKLPGSDKVYTAPVVKICRVATGQGIIMSRSAFEELGGDFSPNVVYTRMTVPSDLKTKRPEVSSVSSKEMLVEMLDNSKEVSYTTSYILAVVAVIMGVVVVYNLGVLSYIEKTREIATLKVLGFHTGSIRFILLQQSLVITAVGAILGVPFGVIMLDKLADMVMLIYFDMVVEPSAFPYIGAIAGTFLVSVIVNVYVSSKVKTIDMVEALKSRE